MSTTATALGNPTSTWCNPNGLLFKQREQQLPPAACYGDECGDELRPSIEEDDDDVGKPIIIVPVKEEEVKKAEEEEKCADSTVVVTAPTTVTTAPSRRQKKKSGLMLTFDATTAPSSSRVSVATHRQPQFRTHDPYGAPAPAPPTAAAPPAPRQREGDSGTHGPNYYQQQQQRQAIMCPPYDNFGVAFQNGFNPSTTTTDDGLLPNFVAVAPPQYQRDHYHHCQQQQQREQEEEQKRQQKMYQDLLLNSVRTVLPKYGLLLKDVHGNSPTQHPPPAQVHLPVLEALGSNNVRWVEYPVYRTVEVGVTAGYPQAHDVKMYLTMVPRWASRRNLDSAGESGIDLDGGALLQIELMVEAMIEATWEVRGYGDVTVHVRNVVAVDGDSSLTRYYVTLCSMFPDDAVAAINALHHNCFADRTGFWIATNGAGKKLMCNYGTAARGLWQDLRHFVMGNVPCQPIVAELARK